MLPSGSSGRARRVRSSGLAALLGALLLPFSAAATPITLSDATSDALSIAAADMDATLTFSVNGSVLTVDVTNDAIGGVEPLLISELFFNMSSAVQGLTLISSPVHSVTGEPLWEGLASMEALTFGTFDFGLNGIRVGNGPNRENGEVLAGTAVSFDLNITGSGVTAADFGSEMSIIVAGDTEATGAALFKGDAVEAYGAQITVVPEPGTAVLMTLGLVSLAWVGKRGNT